MTYQLMNNTGRTYELAYADGNPASSSIAGWKARLKASERYGSSSLSISGDREAGKRKLKFKIAGQGFTDDVMVNIALGLLLILVVMKS